MSGAHFEGPEVAAPSNPSLPATATASLECSRRRAAPMASSSRPPPTPKVWIQGLPPTRAKLRARRSMGRPPPSSKETGSREQVAMATPPRGQLQGRAASRAPPCLGRTSRVQRSQPRAPIPPSLLLQQRPAGLFDKEFSWKFVLAFFLFALNNRLDPNTSFMLKIKLVSKSKKHRNDAKCWAFEKVVDSDLTNFTDLVQSVVEEFPPDYLEVPHIQYYDEATKTFPEIKSDQELMSIGSPKKRTKKAKEASSSILPFDNDAPPMSMSFPPSQTIETIAETTTKKKRKRVDSTPEPSNSQSLEITSKKKGQHNNSNSGGSKRSRSGSNQPDSTSAKAKQMDQPVKGKAKK
ncbi:hypothetical protein EJB05_57448, partial [Eragrostis curvula]